jgi:hypothetical protein
MPYIFKEIQVDVDINDFLESCSLEEKKELIKNLKEDDL